VYCARREYLAVTSHIRLKLPARSMYRAESHNSVAASIPLAKSRTFRQDQTSHMAHQQNSDIMPTAHLNLRNS
jgi:coproporphyrinogen III oxidase